MSDPVTDVWYWAPFTDEDHSGEGWIFGITALIVVCIVTSLRLFLRRGVYGLDDAFIGSSLIAYLAQHALLFFALRLGLGKDNALIRTERQHTVAKAFLTADVLAVCAHYLAKMSIAWFIRRLFFNHALINSLSCNSLTGSVVVCGVISIIIAAVGRFPLGVLEGYSSPSSIVHKWAAITALDVINEIALAAIPTYMVLKIMKKGSQKTLVSIVFLSRLPLCVFTLLHFFRIQWAVSDEKDLILRLLACSGSFEVLLVWSLITASIPALKSLMQPFNEIKEVVDEKDASPRRQQGAFFYRG
ncbi:hypothetical protein C1H76_6191 [Elsinoe australis]|uniref:Rhodopsin domain-containing protein n=1 Tax=Elsinoe australis TaxID=40998 RepID=A0A4U7AWU7_9PEZI|nr:hypothetical protein C1H76_6191 [Elsinoe australis]